MIRKTTTICPFDMLTAHSGLYQRVSDTEILFHIGGGLLLTLGDNVWSGATGEGSRNKFQHQLHKGLFVHLPHHIRYGFPWSRDRIELEMLTHGKTATTWNVCQLPNDLRTQKSLNTFGWPPTLNVCHPPNFQLTSKELKDFWLDPQPQVILRLIAFRIYMI